MSSAPMYSAQQLIHLRNELEHVITAICPPPEFGLWDAVRHVRYAETELRLAQEQLEERS